MMTKPRSLRLLGSLICMSLIFGLCGPIDFTPSAVAATSGSKAKAGATAASVRAQIKKVKEQIKKAKRISSAARKRAVLKRLKKKLKKLKRQLAKILAPFIEMVTVGNPGNGADSTTYGAVPYVFQIGKYEVTLNQYTAFLNAVAATDTYGLYNVSMQITQTGSVGSLTYTVIGSGKRPVAYVSWFDAARFCNWLHNGRSTTGVQDDTTTEDGAYGLFGATNGAVGFVRGPLAKYWIPSEDEWYKAAYYDPRSEASGGPPGDDNYWLYPTRSDSAPTAEAPPGVPGTNSANFSSGVGATTDGGAYLNSPSYYGTFDQGGNIREWDDAVIGANRGLRGSSWDRSAVRLSTADRDDDNPDLEGNDVGFRIARP